MLSGPTDGHRGDGSVYSDGDIQPPSCFMSARGGAARPPGEGCSSPRGGLLVPPGREGLQSCIAVAAHVEATWSLVELLLVKVFSVLLFIRKLSAARCSFAC